MGEINWLAVVVAAVAFFAVGAVWYTALFGKAWQKATGLSDEQLKAGRPMWLIFGLAFLFELLICTMLGHMFARLSPTPPVIMMLSAGMGATIMTPAVGINYLFLRKSGKLFAIDAGHLIVGMTVVGLVFVALG